MASRSTVMTSLNGRAVKDEKAIYGVSISGRTVTVIPAVGSSVSYTTQDTTYSDATSSSHGLLSLEDKSKLDALPAKDSAFTWGRLANKS